MDFLLHEVREGIYSAIRTAPFYLQWSNPPLAFSEFEVIDTHVNFFEVLLWER